PLLHEALVRMGRRDLIGDGPGCLIPAKQPQSADYRSPRRKNSSSTRPSKGKVLTQHNGLPPRNNGSKPGRSRPQA
ncbi:MAG: DUF3362 domain-containing protein, partial [Thiopseudomonas sp.]